jgi:hypothetical protein
MQPAVTKEAIFAIAGLMLLLTLGVSLAGVVLPLWPPRGHDMGRPKQYLA